MTVLQEQMNVMLDGMEWDYFITANMNRPTNWLGARRLLKDWHARVDRKLLGKNWAQKHDKRSFFIAFYEGAETNEHWHLLLKVANEKNEIFENIAGAHWDYLVQSGSLDVQRLATRKDAQKAGSYMTKELYKDGAIESFILSTEFQNK